MSIFLLPPHPTYNCPMCDEAMSEVPEGKLLNWARRKHIFIHECFQVLPSLLSPSASLLFIPSGIKHAASRFGLVGFFWVFFFFFAAQGFCVGLRNARKSGGGGQGRGRGQRGVVKEESGSSKLFFSPTFASNDFLPPFHDF